MSGPDVPLTFLSIVNLKCHLLQTQAETFAYELQREMHLISMGLATSSEGWIAYLQGERQKILDELHQYERARNEHLDSSLRGIPVASLSSHPAIYHPAIPHAHPGSLPHMDGEAYHRLPHDIPHSTDTQNIIGQYACRCNSTTCNLNRQQGRADRSVLHEHRPDSFAQASMSALGSRERALLQHLQLGQSPVANTSSSLALHHSSDGLEEHPRLPSTPSMFHGAHGTTINGGVFYLVQGNVNN